MSPIYGPMVASAHGGNAGSRGAVLTKPPGKLRLTKADAYELLDRENQTVGTYWRIEVQLQNEQGQAIVTYLEGGETYQRALWNMALLLTTAAPPKAKPTVLTQLFHRLADSPN